MDVVLGVAVTGRVARLAMVGSPATGGEVFDQYALDLPDDAMTDLADTIVGTYRAVGDSGNTVAATRLCLPDPSQAETLQRAVVDAGVPNVEVVAESEAAAALARSVGADAALLLSDDDTVSLTVIGEDEESTSVLASLPIGVAGAAVACAAVLAKVPAADAPQRIMLVSQRLDLNSVAAELSSTTPVEVPPDAGYAIARGAAQTANGAAFPAGAATMMGPVADATMMAPASDATQMAPAPVDATQMAPAAGDATQMARTAGDAVVGPQLAYSEEEPGEYELPFDSLEEFIPEMEDEAAYTAMIAPPPPRKMLLGSALGFVVVAFATLAVTVVTNIRPVADVQAQPAPAPQQQAQTVPGNYLPAVPHEPDPVALPVAVVSPAPAAPVRQAPINRGPNSVAPEAPASAPDAPPGPAPAPDVPVVPVVPILPFPPFNPFPTIPTYTTTVTTSVTPTTTTTSPTTTTSTTTPTTTTTTPTTTSEQTTTSKETTTTSSEAPILLSPHSVVPVSPQTEPPVTHVEPAYTAPSEPAYVPPAVAPAPVAPVEPVAPAPAPAQVAPAPAPAAPVVPEAPSSGSGGYGSGSGSGSGGGGSVQAPATTVLESP